MFQLELKHGTNPRGIDKYGARRGTWGRMNGIDLCEYMLLVGELHTLYDEDDEIIQRDKHELENK